MTESTPNSLLKTMPRKAALPIIHLHRLGIIDDELIEMAVKAATLSNKKEVLPGVVIAIQQAIHLGAPVKDTIRMAERLGRKINPLWSCRRWKEEHDLLSRLDTMVRLSSENEEYDLKEFERHLPDEWPGYLIRNSRRLGMEGLRQRHCVASWHARLKMRTCAIAVVFIAKKRWTVEIFIHGGHISLGQIKSRFNESPDTDVRSQIEKLLGMDTNGYVAGVVDTTNQWKTAFRRLVRDLNRTGTGAVTICFDGSGDSGDIVDITPQNDIDLDSTEASVYKRGGYTYNAGERTWQEGEFRLGRLYEAIESCVYLYLDSTNVNWYDGEGGFGEVVIDPYSETLKVEINVRTIDHYTELDTTLHPLEN